MNAFHLSLSYLYLHGLHILQHDLLGIQFCQSSLPVWVNYIYSFHYNSVFLLNNWGKIDLGISALLHTWLSTRTAMSTNMSWSSLIDVSNLIMSAWRASISAIMLVMDHHHRYEILNLIVTIFIPANVWRACCSSYN